MNLFFSGKTAVILIGLSLLAYGFNPYVNSALGLNESLLSQPWQLIAISLGVSLIAGFAYPFIRGIKKGDFLLASVKREVMQDNKAMFSNDFVPVTALESGRVGGKIKIVFQNGLQGEGVITSYAGTIQPSTLRLTETEGVFNKS